MKRALVGCQAVLATSLLLWAADVPARDDMSGVWKEQYTESIVQVDQWNAACGETPRSSGRRKRGILYTVEDRGVELVFKPASGKGFSTSFCMSANKALEPKERTVRDKLFMVQCATSEKAQSYESGRYSFRVVSADRITYRETTRYSRNIEGALCVHTRRVRRLYTRQKNASPPKPPDQVGAKVPGAKEDTRPKKDPCAKPGKPVRIALLQKQATVKRGEKICPPIEAVDKNDCPVDATLTWGRGKPPRGVKLTIQGCLKITDKARGGTHKVRLKAAGKELVFTLEIPRRAKVARHGKPDAGQPSEPPAEEDTEDGGATPADTGAVASAPPQPEDAGIQDAGQQAAATGADEQAAALVKADAGQQAAAAGEESPQEPAPGGTPAWILPVAAGAGGLLLVVIVVLLLRRGRSPRRAGSEDTLITAPPDDKPRPGQPPAVPPPTEDMVPTDPGPGAGKPATPAAKPPESKPALTSSDTPDQVFCTTCGKAVPAEARFCPYDRTPIYRPRSPTIESAPVCPTCKRLLPVGAKFCPYDRTKLG